MLTWFSHKAAESDIFNGALEDAPVEARVMRYRGRQTKRD
jgi:hypothetical protein